MSRLRWNEDDNHRELLIHCDCNVHIAGFSFYFNRDKGEDFGYVEFGTLYDDGETFVWSFHNLKNRMKAAWNILRGKRNYFNEIVLSPYSTRSLALFLNKVVEEESEHYEKFSFAHNAVNALREIRGLKEIDFDSLTQEEQSKHMSELGLVTKERNEQYPST